MTMAARQVIRQAFLKGFHLLTVLMMAMAHHLRVTVHHLRVTVHHLRVTVHHLQAATVHHLQATAHLNQKRIIYRHRLCHRWDSRSVQ